MPTPSDLGSLQPPTVSPPVEEADLRAHARAANDLGVDLFRRATGDGDAVVSPASIHLALSLAWLGARGETRAQLGRVLGVDDHEERAAATLLHEWNDPALRDAEIRVVQRIFADAATPLEDGYQTQAQRFFAAPVEAVDFRHAPEQGRERINAWVAEQTNRRIESLLPAGTVDDETRAVLTNAIYFLSKWQTPFEKDATRPATFHTAGGRAKQVPTMHDTRSARWGEAPGVSLLELPYRNSRFTMLFVLPSQRLGLPAVEQRLSSRQVEEWVDALASQRVQVALPKVDFREGPPLLLADTLQAMGVTAPFSRAEADFRDISDPADPRQRLAIGQVVHKGTIRIDEDGTEAAAATAVVMLAGAAPSEPEKRFVADHPFLFLLRDVSTGAILFLGRVTDP